MANAVTAADSRIRCRDLMTTNIRTATPETTLREAAQMMREGDVGAVPVVENGRLVGIITDRDVVIRAVADGKPADSPVTDAMTRELVTAAPDDFVFAAARLMGDKQVRRLPIVDADGSLVGILAMADVALSMDDEQQIAETLEEISSGSSFWQKS